MKENEGGIALYLVGFYCLVYCFFLDDGRTESGYLIRKVEGVCGVGAEPWHGESICTSHTLEFTTQRN